MTRPNSTWPNGAVAAVSVTMDNMGEAADIHRGVWPKDAPVGSHHSVRQQLPKMLDLLEERSIIGTYFAESWNCNIYPDAINDIKAHGHEVAWHAFQHEVWANLTPEQEVENLNKSLAYAAKIGVKYLGFRPPGGMITPQTLRLLRENGMHYLSPAAERCAIVDGIAMVPFRWRDIDAYFYLDACAPLRRVQGDSEAKLGSSVLQRRLISRIDKLATEGGFMALLFHPFLTTTPERLGAMRAILDHLLTKSNIWAAPSYEIAEWILKHPESFGNDPGWDNAEWKKN